MERRPLPHQSYAAKADDEFDRLFPGSTLTHLLTVVSRDQLDVAIEALLAIRALGGGLDALHLTRVGAKMEHRMRVTGLRPHQARTLSNRLAATPAVERASVEHQILRLSRPEGA